MARIRRKVVLAKKRTLLTYTGAVLLSLSVALYLTLKGCSFRANEMDANGMLIESQ